MESSQLLVNAASQSHAAESLGVKPVDWSVISAVNNESVLRSCLLSSPDIRFASQVILQTGYNSAAAAYNAGIEKAKTDILVLVHQDVYLPARWLNQLQ